MKNTPADTISYICKNLIIHRQSYRLIHQKVISSESACQKEGRHLNNKVGRFAATDQTDCEVNPLRE